MYKIEYHKSETGVKVQVCTYAPDGGVAEIHAILQVEERVDEPFVEQYKRICKEVDNFVHFLNGATVVMKRYFVSDAANQAPQMNCKDDNTSIIQQPPLNGSKIALWIYLQKGKSNYTTQWTMNMMEPEGDSYHQTRTLLERYEAMLQKDGMTLADNCIRTWFFVRDVDTQYKGLVVARRENFEGQQLTNHTHYLASTGIQGLPSNPKAIIQLGAVAIKDIQPGQQTYLYAPTHLNPTYEYGVTFERGVKVTFGDRSHLYISGTASINNKGEVVHVGDIRKQTQRMWENVEALLAEGEATFDDVTQIVAYLRDIADYKVVDKMFAEKFPDTPYVITYAPVCRPAWLIEMECMAITDKGNKSFKAY